MSLSTIDIVVVVIYAIAIFSLAQYVAREKKGHEKDTSDYFLASKNLPWRAIGASLIAANISAEQIVGMSGSGYAIGLAIASYEWMAAITLLIVGEYFATDLPHRRWRQLTGPTAGSRTCRRPQTRDLAHEQNQSRR